MKIKGNIIDVHRREIYFGEIETADGRIATITQAEGSGSKYILPGFVDAHVHIESSMLVPSQFARLAVRHGTVATVSDPHEIANVLGIEGVRYMIADSKRVPFKFNFGAPSCVPATDFETAGARIDVAEVREILEMPEIGYLAEMMNYPGVISNDEMVMAKIAVAHELGKPVDGHAPGLRGEAVETYISAGISTDHESSSYEEGLEKLQLGMKLLIREGSAAKNFEALIDLLSDYPEMTMFCSDDKHPDDLIAGHINQLVARALKKGCELFDVLQVACVNPVKHYGLDVGLLRVGDPADFIVTEDITEFSSCQTYIDGNKVAANGESYIETVAAPLINNFNIEPVVETVFELPAEADKIRVIKAVDGELVTQSFVADTTVENGNAISNTPTDVLKMAVINRYQPSPPALAFINGFELKNGAIASCVGHDSHNIIAVGCDDVSIAAVVNAVIHNKGGIAAISNGGIQALPLPVGGIMTNGDAFSVAEEYTAIDRMVKEEMACQLNAPFMTLSFMALLVIPSLKLGDRGLFDGESFKFTELFVS